MTLLSLVTVPAAGYFVFGSNTEVLNMKFALCAFVLATLSATSSYGQDQFAERCTGTETVQVGHHAPRAVPYTLSFSADLSAGYYCYAACRPEQTYRIKDGISNPIKLADLDTGSQTRDISFDRRTGILTDRQVLKVLNPIRRDAKAICRPAVFRKPTPLPGD